VHDELRRVHAVQQERAQVGEAGAADAGELAGTERIDGGHEDRPRRFHGRPAIAGDNQRDNECGERQGTAHSELQIVTLVWTAAHERGIGLDILARWMAAAPAALAGLTRRKGTIAAGNDADLVLFDDSARFIVDAARLHQRHPITPYAGRELRGRVETTFLRGRRVFHRDQHAAPAGRVLLGRDPR